MLSCRDLNVATSRSVFAGPYIKDEAEEEKFGKAFLDMTEGFLALPICIPGTAVWKAKKGRLYILGVLERGAAESKAAMKVGTPAYSSRTTLSYNILCGSCLSLVSKLNNASLPIQRRWLDIACYTICGRQKPC